MSDELVTFLTAMTPIGELRASIPLGLLTFDLPVWSTFLLSVTGNMVPVPFLILLLRKLGAWLERQNNPLGSLLQWRTNNVRSRYAPQLARYGPMSLVLLVAVPLPVTGVWTGSLAVWALHMPLRQGLAAIAAGVLIAGGVVTGLSVAGIELFSRLA